LKTAIIGFVTDVGIAEAKNRLPKLIRAVENGEEAVITRHGKASPNWPRHRQHGGKFGLAPCAAAYIASRDGTIRLPSISF
jgi:hypothetical protein